MTNSVDSDHTAPKRSSLISIYSVCSGSNISVQKLNVSMVTFSERDIMSFTCICLEKIQIFRNYKMSIWLKETDFREECTETWTKKISMLLNNCTINSLGISKFKEPNKLLSDINSSIVWDIPSCFLPKPKKPDKITLRYQ